MSDSSSKRRSSMGVHPNVGRRYNHVELTSHQRGNRRARRKHLLVVKALQAVEHHYTEELGPDLEGMEEFKHEVGRRLRGQIGPEWTQAQTNEKAIEIAENLLDELEQGLDEENPDEDHRNDRI